MGGKLSREKGRNVLTLTVVLTLKLIGKSLDNTK
jgi:hypothetical protein